MKITRLAVIILFVVFSSNLFSQTQPTFEKTTYRDSVNRLYIQTELPLYLFVATDPQGKNMHELSQNNSDTVFNKPEPMYLDGNGKHHIQHFDVFENKPIIFPIWADGIAPTSTASFSGAPKFIVGKSITYGVGLEVNITTTDDISGVKKVFCSINGAQYLEYKEALRLQKEGENVLKFFAVDNVGNTAEIAEKNFIIDRGVPKTYHTITGISQQDSTNILSTTSIIYLEPTDVISGVAKTYYKFDTGSEAIYDGKSIPIVQLNEGSHTLYYYSVDNVNNKELAQSFTFYLDKSAPIVATDVLGDRFIVDNRIYFSGRSKLKITAIDNKIGVKNVLFSIDGSDFQKYNDPFYLPSKPGIHVIRYFAEDSLENSTQGKKGLNRQEYRHNVSKVYLDLTGPALSYEFSGLTFETRDTIFINTTTKIKLSYSDLESGTKKLAYTINSNPTEIDYKEPISITTSGFNSISAIGYDNVNNRNFKTFNFVVDGNAPEINTQFSVDPLTKFESLPIYPPFVVLYVAPFDNLTGVKQIQYSVNGQPKKIYTGKIEGFKKGEKNTVKIEVSDNLNNESTKEIQFYILEK